MTVATPEDLRHDPRAAGRPPVGCAVRLYDTDGTEIYPLEVENLICGHPEVQEAAVLGVADPDFGQRLKAYVVRTVGSSLTADEIKDYIRANLARCKVLRDVEFLDVLPRNTTGKLLRGSLTEGSAR